MTSATLFKYYLLDTNANETQRYRLIELKDQFGQLRNASNAVRNYASSTNPTTSVHSSNVHQSNVQSSTVHSSAHSPKHSSSSIKINTELLQFCLDLNQLLKLMECSKCKYLHSNLRSALYLQLKHAISINQQENDRIVAYVRRFEGKFYM